MKSYEVAIDYYDALFNIKTQNKTAGLTLQTHTKIRNLITKSVLTDPEAINYFIQHITPDTHYITGFCKPWEWYKTYKHYPDVLEHLLMTYYQSEYTKKSKNDTVLDRQSSIRPFTKTNGNKFINLYDENELLQVRHFTNYIIANKLFKCKSLLSTLAYIHALTGTPKVAFELYGILMQDEHHSNQAKVQDYFYFFIKSLYKDLGYALDTKYSHGLLTRNILYSKNGDGNSLKSFRMLLTLIIEDMGYKSIFEENLTYRKVISNLRKYGEYLSTDSDFIINVSSIEMCSLMPVTFEYLYMLSTISNKVKVPNNKELRRSINSGIHITTNSDKHELDSMYKLSKDERENLQNDIKKTATLLIGI